MRTSSERHRRRGAPAIMIAGVAMALVSGMADAGYDAHVTRRANWASHTGSRISLAEWRAYVATDKQIKPAPHNSKNDFLIELPGEEVFLLYDPDRGELRVTDPSPQTLEKLIQIARGLHARVQGDEGEFYPAPVAGK
jgi:hypothetical protein